MRRFAEIFAPCTSWREPRVVAGNPFRLMCHFEPLGDAQELEKARDMVNIPSEVAEFWGVWREASLFVDVDYGQWGLELLSPSRSAARTVEEMLRRPKEFDVLDLVIGEFIGDQELLVIDSAGEVLVALPLDERKAWHRAAGNFFAFLCKYIDRHGAKYWEEAS